MDVYTAKLQIEKLLEYVEHIADSKPRMYKKSKDRWKDIAVMCHQVISSISEIVQEEVMQSDEEGSTFDRDSDILAAVVSMQKEIDRLKQFVSYSLPPSSTESTDTSSITKTSYQPSKISKAKIPSQVRKSMLSEYISCMKSSVDKCKGEYIEAEECLKLLHRWMYSRFFKSSEKFPNFRYNIRRIPMWVRDIVIVYGKHVSLGTSDEFVHKFNEWCDDLEYSENSTNFSVPYEIYRVNKNPQTSDISLTSVVLWDILLDYGLSELCVSDDKYQLYLSENMMYDMCRELNPSELDMYVDYKSDTDILTKCNISTYR